jgi:hypothetical protein
VASGSADEVEGNGPTVLRERLAFFFSTGASLYVFLMSNLGDSLARNFDA